MPNTLVAPDDLTDFPGAPFDESILDAVVDFVRVWCRWHIAPQVEETVAVESRGTCDVDIPVTLRLTSIAEVRDVTDGGTGVVDDYRTDPTLKFTAGVVTHRHLWPCGILEFDIVHGYESCPPALLPAIAEMARMQSPTSTGNARGDLAQRTLGDLSETYRALSTASQEALAAYRIH